MRGLEFNKSPDLPVPERGAQLGLGTPYVESE